MKRNITLAILIVVCFTAGIVFQHLFAQQKNRGYVLQRDAEVARQEPAPHKGGGNSTAYNFFANEPGQDLAFRKRALHKGAAIGYHLQKENEIYYILSGEGVMQMNGETFPVKAGDAILTLPGSSHGLKQTGEEDLVLLINYQLQRSH